MNNFEPRYTKLASQYLLQKLEALTIKEPKPKSLLTKVMSNFKKKNTSD